MVLFACTGYYLSGIVQLQLKIFFQEVGLWVPKKVLVYYYYLLFFWVSSRLGVRGNWWKTVGVSWYTVYWQQMFCNLCVGSYRMPQFHFVSNCTHCILTNSVSWNLAACFQNPRMRRLQPSCFRAIETTNVSVSQSLLVLTSPSVTMLVM